MSPLLVGSCWGIFFAVVPEESSKQPLSVFRRIHGRKAFTPQGISSQRSSLTGYLGRTLVWRVLASSLVSSSGFLWRIATLFSCLFDVDLRFSGK